jgi:PAS domain S-box-containing protein
MKQKEINQQSFDNEQNSGGSNEEFKTILYSIGDGVITTDNFCKIRLMNHAAEELTGWTECEAAGKSIDDIFNIINEESGDKVENPVHLVLKKGNIVGLANHTLLIRKDGKKIPIADSGAPIRNNKGNIDGVVLVFRDKSVEHQNEELIRKSEIRLTRAELASRSGNWELHLKSNKIIASKGAEILYGLHGDEFNYSAIRKIPLPEFRPLLDNALRRLIEIGEPYDLEFKIKNYSTGEILDIHSRAEYDANEKILFGTIQDITKQKNIERALLQSEEKIRTTLYSIGDGVISTDEVGNVTQMNHVAENLTGYCEPEAIGKPLDDVFKIINEITRNTVENPVHKVLKEGKIVGLANHTLLISKNGVEIPIADSGAPIIGPNSEITGVVLVFSDQTFERNAQKVLQESEMQLKQSQLVTRVGYYIFDISTGFWTSSEMLDNLFGIGKDYIRDIAGWLNVVLPDYKVELQQYLHENVIDRKNKFDKEYKIRNLKTGEDFWVYGMGNLEFDENGVPVKMFGTIQDISHRKISEVALIESEERYRTIFESHFAIMMLFDPETGNIIEANQAAAEFYGWPRETLSQMNIKQINTLSAEDIAKKMSFVSEQNSVHFEFRHRRADGSVRDVEVFSCVVRIKGKNFIHSIIHDITDKKVAEKQLNLLTYSIEQSPVCIVITNADANIEYVNPYLCRLTGYCREELLGMNSRIFKSDETTLAEYQSMWDKLTSGESWTGIFHNKKKNGDLYWETSNITPIKDNAGKVINYIAIKEIIDERMEKEIELNKYREHLEEMVKMRTKELDSANSLLKEQLLKEKEIEMMLKESLKKEVELNELKTRFISTTSHEFRTPLTTVLSSAELIQLYSKNWTKEKLNQQINRIIESVNYLTKLLEDILVINRSEMGKILFSPQLIDIENYCLAIIKEAEVHSKKSQNFVFSCIAEPRFISVDPKLLKFMLVNLLSNAFKYSPENGNIEFHIQTIEGKLLIRVSDNGIGIPDEEKGYLFQPFHRCKNSSDFPGSGLGLSIVKKAVEIHRGEISFSSELNNGTVFTILLPFRH